MKTQKIFTVALFLSHFFALSIFAQSNPPANTNSFTLEDLYNRLNAGTNGAQRTFTEPTTAPGVATMFSINQIMGKMPVPDNTTGAITGEVLTGKTFWGLRTDGTWGLQIGSVPAGINVTGAVGELTITIPDGFYSNSKTATAQDPGLIPANIKSGVSIFGVNGTLRPASVPKTGLTISYTTGDDGDKQKGVELPTPRFTDQGNGTILDNLTGLIWLKNANCNSSKTWSNALADANWLENGSCGLTDGSQPGDWRIPNVKELQSLIDYGRTNPALPENHPFTGVQSDYYWTSTTLANIINNAWSLNIGTGALISDGKNTNHYLWLVRGGE